MNSFKNKLEILKKSDEDELVSNSYDFVDEIESEFGFKYEFLEPIFTLFEERPDDDFGAPGPLVHYIEKIEDYEKELMNSLNRKPTIQNLMVINRLLNGNYSEKDIFIKKLNEILKSGKVDDKVVKEYIDELISGNM